MTQIVKPLIGGPSRRRCVKGDPSTATVGDAGWNNGDGMTDRGLNAEDHPADLSLITRFTEPGTGHLPGTIGNRCAEIHERRGRRQGDPGAHVEGVGGTGPVNDRGMSATIPSPARIKRYLASGHQSAHIEAVSRAGIAVKTVFVYGASAAV